MKANRFWHPQQDDTLKKLYKEGMSCAQIAAEMNCGFTRNAVIGRVHRLKLPLRGQGIYPDKAKRAKQEKRQRTPTLRVVRANSNSGRLRVFESVSLEVAKLRCVGVEPRNLSLAELSASDCRYPYGDNPFLFCGHAVVEGHSYCFAHQSLTTAKDQDKRRIKRMPGGLDFRRAFAGVSP